MADPRANQYHVPHSNDYFISMYLPIFQYSDTSASFGFAWTYVLSTNDVIVSG